MNQWWWYEHESWSLQVKRYFWQEDIIDARESPFVARIFGPFMAKDRGDALEILRNKLYPKS